MQTKNFRFYIKKWIDNDLFREILSFANYLGRDHSRGSMFEISIKKIKDRNIDKDYILDILERAGAEPLEGNLGTLVDSALSSSKRISVTISYKDGVIVIKPDKFLGGLIDGIRNMVKYDRSSKSFLAFPYNYVKIIKYFKSYSFIDIIDNIGFDHNKKLPIKASLSIELRPYQSEAINSWVNNSYSGIIALPTGSGKTVVGVAAISKINVWTLIVAFTREQMIQWKEHLVRYANIPSGLIGLFYSDEKRIAPITITTYQTAFRHVDRLNRLFPLLIIDEVHHLPADKFRGIALKMFSPYRLGLSATVVREDGRHEELFPLMGGVIYHKSPQELAEQGYLATYEIRTIRVDLTKDEKTKFEELRKKYRSLAGDLDFEDLLRLARSGDEKAIEALKVRAEMKQLIHNSKNKLNALKMILKKEIARGSKIIIFTQYVDHAEYIGKELNIPVITGETDGKLRKLNFDRFRSGEIKAIVMTTVGDEGIDVPDANVGIIVAGTGSRRQFIQRLGRLLRPDPSGRNKKAILYEIVARGTPEEYEAKKRRKALDSLDLWK